MLEKLVGDLLIFLATIDPVSTLALFVGLTAGASAAQRTKIALRCIGFSAAILVVFIILGQLILGLLGVSLASFQLAGGIIFFLFGVQMVFGSGAAANNAKPNPDQDVAVFPLAVPSIASPGAILACVVLTDNNEFSILQQALTAAVLLAVLGISLLALLMADRIYRLIGNSGAMLLVRVLGLILAALAVEMTLEAGVELVREIQAGATL